MNVKYLVLPGYGNSDENHWQSYFERHLPNCKRVIQKDWVNPECSDWINNINDSILELNSEPIVFITHSLGGIALQHWAANFKANILGAFIVAPPDLENAPINLGLSSFLPIPFSPLPFPSIVIGSTKDPCATVEKTITFANQCGSENHFIENAGHINSNSGYGKWDEGILILKNFVKSLKK
jgi:uncharacterized protein